MSHTFEELEVKTVAELREIAKETERDYRQLKILRRRIHRLKRKIRAATV